MTEPLGSKKQLLGSHDSSQYHACLGSEEESDEDHQDQMPSKLTINEAIEKASYGWGTVMLTLGPFWIIAFEGCEVIIASIVGLVLKCEWSLSIWGVITLQCAAYVGLAIGSAISAKPSETYGRKPLMQIGNIGLLIFGVACAGSPNFWVFLCLRGITGIFVGLAVGPATTYISEICGVNNRALFMSLFTVSWAVGSVVCIFVAYLVMGVFGLSWRWCMFVSTVIFLPVAFLLQYKTDYSPRYLVCKGDMDQAQDVMEKLFKRNRVEMKFKLVDTVDRTLDVRGERNITRYLISNGYLGSLIWFNVNFVATALIFLSIAFAAPRFVAEGYCTDLNVTAGLTTAVGVDCQFSASDLKDTTLTTLLTPISPVLAALLSDRIGRRSCIGLIGVMILINTTMLDICVNRVWLVGNLVMLQALAYAVDFLPFVFIAEYYPTEIRSFAMAVIYTSARVGCVFGVITAQLVYDFGPRYALMVIQIASVFFIFSVVMIRRETLNAPMD